MVGAGTVACVGARQCGEFFAVPTYVLKVPQGAPRWWADVSPPLYLSKETDYGG